MENILNNFLISLEENLKHIEEEHKENYILYKINNILKETNNNLYLHNSFTNLLAKNNIDTICKIKYTNKIRKIILITQYYKTNNEKRSKENYICLLNNILNDNIDKIILLNEEEYDLNFLFNNIDNKYKSKLKQINIESRLRYYDAFNYVNTYYKNNIIIVANLDIFFDNNINKLKDYDLTNKFFSLSRYDLKNDYNFNDNNEIEKFIHEGPLGNPCIDSADTWIFESPIKHGDKTKIMLGANGCDTAINYIMKYDYKYDIYNPINSIITIHYHLMTNKERENYNKNSIMTYGDKIYNTKNEFKPLEINHLYLNHKTIQLCNKIESFCTFATKSAYKDLRLLLHSLELYHNDIPIFIICDKWINNKIDNDNYNLIIYKKIDLEKYTDLNRKNMEEQNIFTDFLLNKAYVINYAMEKYSNTLFIDADIVILNKMDLLIDSTCDVGLSPHNIFEKNQKKFGIYNAGFMYVANKDITKYWIHIINTTNTFVDQQALDYFEEKFKVFKFDDSYNYGWWRLFQCDEPQKRANLFTVDNNNVYYEYKTLKCIHTHLYQQNDQQTISFNSFILELLEKINHPMLNFINNTNLSNTIKNNNNNNENKNIETDIKPTIIIPKMPRNDFWYHTGDTFRELVYMWKQQNLCNIIEGDTKHVWFNKIGDVLLYDRPTLEWLDKDNNIRYNKILFGNPEIPDKLKDKAYNWIFWGRRPFILEQISKNILSYNERTIKSIFIGKIENQIQNKYRSYEDWSKYIEIYKMHLPNEKYIYTQDQYLNLLKNSKFGLSIRGYGPKCNREIELMALGTVPIIDNNVNMDYFNKPIENVHYFRISKPDEITNIINNCSEKQWTNMSNACRKWYEDNCSCISSFNITMKIIKNLENNDLENNDLENNDLENNVLENNDLENNVLENNDLENSDFIIYKNKKLIIKKNINEKKVYSYGMEENFIRENLKGFYNIDKIYELHIEKHNDLKWDNKNIFDRIQDKYIAKFENITINNMGIMYDDNNVYTLNNKYYNVKDLQIINNNVKLDDDIIVFNFVQKWGYGYYHWLIEIYPKLFYIKNFIEKNINNFKNKKLILLLYYNDSFIKQYLEILNISNIEICPYNHNIEYICKTVYICYPTHSGNPSKDSINYLRNSIFKNNIFSYKINILLKRNYSRIIKNFNDVYNNLVQNYNDNQWIIFDDSTDISQNIIKTIELFNNANIIIGTHGAGLSNMIYSGVNSKIIELHPNNCGNVCYWHLSKTIENQHIMLLCNIISENEIIVDINKLNYIIDNLQKDNYLFNIKNLVLNIN